MCGILGFTGSKNTPLTNQLLNTIAHRGKDDSCAGFSEGYNFGMKRLAINDKRSKIYPINYKQYLLTFNGEIYNYEAVIQRSLSKKKLFNSNSDAEVILPLFHKYGPSCFRKMEGMFAIAIFDSAKKEIVLARDRFGEKPLFYTFDSDTKFFLFSSELRTLIKGNHSRVVPSINKQQLYEYLHQGFSSGSDTILEKYFQLEPGSYLIYSLKTNRVTVKKYWTPQTLIKNKQYIGEKPVQELDDLLQKSIKLRIGNESKIACYVSGGLDSSLLASLASQYVHVEACSIVYPENASYSEHDYLRKLKNSPSLHNTEIECTGTTARSIVEKMGDYLDFPFVDPTFIPLLLLNQQASKKLKVGLSGLGCDEVFGGYHRYQLQKNLNWINSSQISFFIPSKIKRHLSDSLEYVPQVIWNRSSLNELTHQTLSSAEKTLPGYTLKEMQLQDVRHYLRFLLSEADMASMSFTFELRAPFLDSSIVEFAFKLPPHLLINGLTKKYLLKLVAEKYIPKEIVWRRKHGFTVPLKEWLKKELLDVVWESVSFANSSPIFRGEYYQKIVSEHLESNVDHSREIWSMIILNKWITKQKIILK